MKLLLVWVQRDRVSNFGPSSGDFGLSSGDFGLSSGDFGVSSNFFKELF